MSQIDHHGGEVEARRLVWDAITALPQADVDFLVQKPPIFPTCTQVKTCRYLKPSTMVG